MLIDGQIIAITEQQAQAGRRQLELPNDFNLVEATRLLHHDTGAGWVRIPLPHGLFVVAYENIQGHWRYGVVNIQMPLVDYSFN